MLLAVLLCSPIAAFAVDFNIDIQSSVGASASNASGGGPSKLVDCGSGTCAITTADDGILEYGIAARADIVKTGTSFAITAQGESELLQGSPYVTGTGDFAATIRVYSQTATSEQFVVKTVGDLKVTWQGLIPTSAGKAKAWFGTPCPDWGLNVESDASIPSGEVGPTNKTVRCVRSAEHPWNKILEMTVEMKAAAGNRVVGEKTSFNGTVTFAINPKGKEMLKEYPKDTDPVPEGLVNHPLASPFKIKVIENDTEVAADGVPIQFTVKGPDGKVAKDASGDPIPVINTQTSQDGIASAVVTLGNLPGQHTIEAYCGQCAANHVVVFVATALTRQEATELILIYGDDVGEVSNPLLNSLRVEAYNRFTGLGEEGFLVSFIVEDFPQGAKGPDLDPPSMITVPHGLAETRFTIWDKEGIYRIKAFCDECQGGNRDLNVFISGPSSMFLFKSAANGEEKTVLPIALTAYGDPPGGTYEWSITKNGQLPDPPIVEQLGGNTAPTFQLRAKRPSKIKKDVEMAVTYRVGSKHQMAKHAITVEAPVSAIREKISNNPCSREKGGALIRERLEELKKLPGLYEDAAQEYNLYGTITRFDYRTLNQFDEPMMIPPRLVLAAERGRVAPGNNAEDYEVGDRVDKAAPIEDGGKFTDILRFCYPAPLPANLYVPVDRCVYVGAAEVDDFTEGGVFVLHERAERTADDSAVTTIGTDESECTVR